MYGFKRTARAMYMACWWSHVNYCVNACCYSWPPSCSLRFLFVRLRAHPKKHNWCRIQTPTRLSETSRWQRPKRQTLNTHLFPIQQHDRCILMSQVGAVFCTLGVRPLGRDAEYMYIHICPQTSWHKKGPKRSWNKPTQTNTSQAKHVFFLIHPCNSHQKYDNKQPVIRHGWHPGCMRKFQTALLKHVIIIRKAQKPMLRPLRRITETYLHVDYLSFICSIDTRTETTTKPYT